MAKLGWFDSELRPDGWWDSEIQPSGWWDDEIVDTSNQSAATLDQYSFRFFNDDGGDSSLSYVPVRVDRTSRPPLGTPLRSDGHWSVQGLVTHAGILEGAGKTLWDSIKSKPSVTTNGGVTIDCNGLTSDSPIGSSFDFGDPGIGASDDFTFVGGVLFRTNSAWPPQALMAKSDSWTERRHLYVGGEYPSNKVELVVRHTTTSASASSDFAVPIGVPTVVAGIYDSSIKRCTVFSNGKDVTSARTDGVGEIDQAIGAPVTVSGMKQDNAYYTRGWTQGFIQWASYYLRRLTPEQIASLSANPWQIYEPETIYVPKGSTGATPLADINTNITLTPGSTLRLRLGISASGDPTSKQFQLEYRRKPSGGSFGAWGIVSAGLKWIPVLVDRTSKPPIGTPLRSDGHWSVQGLAYAIAANEGSGVSVFDGVSNYPSQLFGCSLTAEGVVFSGTTNNRIETGRSFDFTNGATIIASYKKDPTSTYFEPLFNNKTDANFSANNGLSFNIRSDGGLLFLVGDQSNYYIPDAFGGTLQRVVCATWKPAILSALYVDGKFLQYGNVANSYVQSPYNAKTGSYYTGTSPYISKGTLFWQYVYATSLTPEQIASLSANPWMIYEPEVQWVRG